jgi:hypothetical protein
MFFRCGTHEFKIGGRETDEVPFAVSQAGKCDPCVGYKCEFEDECRAMNQQKVSEAA